MPLHRLPRGRLHLGPERLEPRALLAGDVTVLGGVTPDPGPDPDAGIAFVTTSEVGQASAAPAFDPPHLRLRIHASDAVAAETGLQSLAAAGFGVFAVADAMASRAAASHQLALERMRQSGVAVVTTEMVVFELLREAGTPQFKALSALIR